MRKTDRIWKSEMEDKPKENLDKQTVNYVRISHVEGILSFEV